MASWFSDLGPDAQEEVLIITSMLGLPANPEASFPTAAAFLHAVATKWIEVRRVSLALTSTAYGVPMSDEVTSAQSSVNGTVTGNKDANPVA